MPRRSSRAELPGTLFPFLSVLACVIGALTLLIATVAISHVGGGLLDLARFQAAEEERAALEVELASLNDEKDAAVVAIAAMSDQRRELASLGLLEPANDADRRRMAELRIEAEKLRRELVTARTERARLTASLARARAELEADEGVVDLTPIVLEPGGSGRDLKPFFVECSAGGLTLHRRGEVFPLPTERIDAVSDARYVVFLRRVRATAGASVIFMLRPDAVEVCQRAEITAEAVGVRYGRLALPGHGEIDFGRVQEWER